MQQTIRFIKSADGVRLAVATSGSGAPLVKSANWLSHLEFDWQSPVWRHWFRFLSAGRQLIRFDPRGCGLSDWDATDLSHDGAGRRSRGHHRRVGSRPLSAARAVAGRRGLHRIRRASSGACDAARAVWLLRRRLGAARRRSAPPRRGADRADPPGLGPGESGVSPAVRVAVHSGRERRAGALVQRPDAHDDAAGDRRAHSRIVRRDQRACAAAARARADAGRARARRRAHSVRAGPAARRRKFPARAS